MISSSLSIKILGCSVGAFVIIGIPLIVKGEKDKKEAEEVEIKEKAIVAGKAERQKYIDKPENIHSFLAKTENTVISEGETFSDEAIKSWNPDEIDKKSIAVNWSSTIAKMPNAFFFQKAQGINWSGNSQAGVCYLTTYRLRGITIPVLKSKLTALKGPNSSARARWASIDTHVGEFLKTNHKFYQKELQKIINANKGRKKEASDLLFLHKLYEDTISRLVELGHTEETEIADTSLLWDFDCK